MRFPSIHEQQFEPIEKLEETLFGTEFLVRRRQRSGEERDETLWVLSALDLSRCTKPTSQLSQELGSLMRLKHEGLLPIEALIEQIDPHTGQKTLALLQRHVPGRALLEHVTEADTQEGDERGLSLGVREDSGGEEDDDEVGQILSELSRSDRFIGVVGLSERLKRLAPLLEQLGEALSYLHRYKRVHGTITPKTILVDGEGRARIKQAGLWQILCEESSRQQDQGVAPAWEEREVLGRAEREVRRYQSPEAILGERLTSRSDLYSVACLAYEALCGESPFGPGSDSARAERRLRGEPTSALAYQPKCPTSWVILLEEMLRREASARPSDEEFLALLKTLPRRESELPIALVPKPDSFHGRPEVLKRLVALASQRRRERVLDPVVLQGGVGQGKHYFIDHLAASLTARGWCVARGRCYDEAIDPYQGWRRIINDVVKMVERAPQELIPTATRHTASVLFPKLAPSPGRVPEAGSVQRLEATAALREMLGAISAERPLLLVFDDLHLATRDTQELLHDVLASDTPFEGMLLVTTPSRAEAIFPDEQSSTWVALPPLTLSEGEALLKRLGVEDLERAVEVMRREPELLAPQLIKEIVHHARHQARPVAEVFEEQLQRASARGGAAALLSEVLGERLKSAQRPIHVKMLHILASWSGALSVKRLSAILRHLMSAPPEHAEREAALAQLVTWRLIRRAESSSDLALGAYRITSEPCRARVRRGMDEKQQMRTHAAISRALRETDQEALSPIVAFEHARLARRIAMALNLSEQAREEASAQLAFSKAAEIQSWVVSQRSESGQRQELAELEAASGQHREAAEQWEKMAATQQRQQRVITLCEAALEWFYAGDMTRSASAQREALAHFNPRSDGSSTRHLSALKLAWSKWTERAPQVPEALRPERASTLHGEEALQARVYELTLRTSVMLHTDQAPAFIRRLERLAVAHASPRELALAWRHHAQWLIQLDLARASRWAQAYLEGALQIAAALGDLIEQAQVNVALAHLAQTRGEWERAKALYLGAEERWRASSETTRMARSELEYSRGLMALALGDLEEVTRLSESLFYEERHLAPAQLRGHQLAAARDLLSGEMTSAAHHIGQIERALKAPGSSMLSAWHIEHDAIWHVMHGEPEVAVAQLNMALEGRGEGLSRMPRVRTRLKMRLAQALAAQLMHEHYVDRSRRRQLFAQLFATIRSVQANLGQLTMPEHAELTRLKIRALWLSGALKRALKLADQDALVIGQGVGHYALLVRREVLGHLWQAAGREDAAQRALRDAAAAYEERGFYAPLAREGWPVMRLQDGVEARRGARAPSR